MMMMVAVRTNNNDVDGDCSKINNDGDDDCSK